MVKGNYNVHFVLAFSGRYYRGGLLSQEESWMDDVESICAESDLHAIQQVEEKLVGDNWAIPSSVEFNRTINGSKI
ncbi:hypothetical protein M408DRAFT_331941, partial [Serendipita vermifera MAFF 305830]